MDLVGGWSARAEWAGIGFLSRLGSRDKMGLIWTALCKLLFFISDHFEMYDSQNIEIKKNA
jgi:hypothetical protein